MLALENGTAARIRAGDLGERGRCRDGLGLDLVALEDQRSVGRHSCSDQRAVARPSYLALDFHEEAVAAAQADGTVMVEGDATRDENLRKAGLDRARGLVAPSDSDADNLYIVLSARSERPDLTIVARASGVDAERKLVLAGADRVVPAVRGRRAGDGEPRAQAAGHRVPRRRDDRHPGPDLQLEEIEVRAAARSWADIREIRIRHQPARS